MQNNFTSKFLLLLLNISGIATESQSYRRIGKFIVIWKYYLIYSFTCLTSGQVMTLGNNEPMHVTCMSLIFIFNGIFLNITIVALHIKKRNIFEMLKIFNNDFVDVSAQSGFPQKTNERFKKFFLSYGVMYFIIYAIMILSPFLFFPISGNKLGDPNTMLIPCWFPWTIDNYTNYVLTIILQFSWLGSLSMPVLLVFLFTAYVLIEVQSQVEILLKVTDEWNHRKPEQMYPLLKKFIQHHQVILRFVGNFCQCYNFIFTANLVYSASNLALLFFVISSDEMTMSTMMQPIAAFFMVLLYLLLYCYIGEVLAEIDEKIKIALYDMNWYQQSLEFQKMFIVLLCILQRNLNLKAGVASFASFELFSKILKMSYSYFNVLSNSM